MKWSPEVTGKVFYWGIHYSVYSGSALGRTTDTAVREKLGDSIERAALPLLL